MNKMSFTKKEIKDNNRKIAADFLITWKNARKKFYTLSEKEAKIIEENFKKEYESMKKQGIKFL